MPTYDVEGGSTLRRRDRVRLINQQRVQKKWSEPSRSTYQGETDLRHKEGKDTRAREWAGVVLIVFVAFSFYFVLKAAIA